MCSVLPSVCILIYVIAINLFGLYLRFIAFSDYFECFACKELDKTHQEFDYIVVGSGSAGSIVARRLAEDSSLRVLLIEAGSEGNSILQIPTMSLLLQNSIFDWQYRTVPQKQACLGMDNKVSLWPMGRILGGTGMLNNMIYTRAHPEDYARWYQDTCNFDYSVDVLPYFQKLENGSKEYKPAIRISDVPFKSNVSDYFLQAGMCMNFQLTDSVNAEPGFSTPKFTMYKGQRWTPYHQLEKTKKSNLVIITNSVVEKVLLQENLFAYGVAYSHLDETHYIRAKKGVVLSAGVIGTPKILMLSGIGPKRHLESLKIPPKLDLPVGDNLQDHVTTGLDLLLINDPPNVGISQMISPLSFLNYFLFSQGPLTSAGCETLAFFNTENSLVPELQFMIMPLGISIDGGAYLRSLVGIGEDVYEKYFNQIEGAAFSILPVVLHPRSRGTVRLKNKNPKTPPLIDPNYLSDKYDVDTLLEGIELIKEFIQTSPMQRLGVTLNRQKFPGCKKFDFDTRPYWECYVRYLTLSGYHPVGTCKLGEVVDFDFQVKGTKNLFVVDGSILPDLPSGNPNGAIMMMAEKAAEVLQHHCWRTQRKCCAAEMFGQECNCE